MLANVNARQSNISRWESTGVPPPCAGGLVSPLSTAYWGNYVCHVCPFARFISHHPSAFTFRARTLLFFRLKLAYSVRAYQNANAVSMLVLSLQCARFLTIHPDGWRRCKLFGADVERKLERERERALSRISKMQAEQPQLLSSTN